MKCSLTSIVTKSDTFETFDHKPSTLILTAA